MIREFRRIRDQLPDILGTEEAWAEGFQCLDLQIALMVTRGVIVSDDAIMQSLAAAGLCAYDKMMQRAPRDWSRLSEDVIQLAHRLVTVFDPDVNREVRDVGEKAWQKPDDQVFHFQTWAAIIARLEDSVKLHSKRHPRGYCRFVTEFVANIKPPSDDEKIHWVVWTRSHPISSEAT